MSELGQRLRAAREARGLTLAQAEEATRIRRDFLQAIEEERFDVLPGAVYVKGFIRNYAQFLGLDPQESLADYQVASGAKGANLPHVLNEPLVQPLRHLSGWGTVGILLLVLLLAAGGWYAYNRLALGQDPWPIPQLRELLAERATPTSAPATQTPSSTNATPPAAQSPTAGDVPTATLTETVSMDTPTPPTPTPSATRTRTPTAIPTATPPLASPTPTSTPFDGFSVELRVLELCYVRALVDGVVVLEKNLVAGENQLWTATENFTMRVGNASGVEVLVNGQLVPPLGAQNQVVDVTYTLDTLP